jgi:hypothetical protein
MDTKSAVIGALPVIILVSAALTAIFSLILLRLYRRSVIRSMATSGYSKAPTPPETTDTIASPTKPPPLTITTLLDEKVLTGRAKTAYEATSASLQRLSLIYGMAGTLYALVLSLPWMLTAGGGYPLVRLLWLFACYVWPAVIVVVLVAATTPRQKKLIFAGYFSFILFIGAIATARNPDSSFGQLLFFWLYVNGAPTLLLATFLFRRIRAVGPLVLAFMVTGITGAVLLVSIVGKSDVLLRAFIEIGYLFGLGASSVFVLINLLGFVVLGILGWRLLKLLGHAYRTKRISDQSLKLDALWLMFAVLQSITLSFEDWWWIFTGLVAFTLYKQITRIGFNRTRSQNNSEKPPSLLLLRVFALGQRSERLFDILSKRWLQAGSIDMIAGPDLVTSTVEPHEFLDYMGGHLSRSFINNPSVLKQRLEQRDRRPDPDGRYRVNEFFCTDDTWQMCMQRLTSDNDVLLMDLRGFSQHSQGCLWELEQLLASVLLERVLFVVDETTDQELLLHWLNTLWKQIPGNSPNLGLTQPQVKLISVPSSISITADQLVKRLFESCYPAQ